MGGIKVISKERGEIITDKTWEYLNKIILSDLTENSKNIILKNENKEISDNTIIINKEQVYANTPKFITYRVRLNYGGNFPGGGIQILLKKYKNDQTKFDLKSLSQKGFKISFQANSGYEDDSLNNPFFNPIFTKKIYLNGQELALFYQALRKELFAVPEKGYLLFESTPRRGGGNLYFDKEYYLEFRNSVIEEFNEGSFSESNDEYEWNQFKNTIEKPTEISNPNILNLKIYLVSK